MKKVLIIVSVVVIALAGIGVGAYFLTREKSPEQQVVGTWYDGENDVTIELKSNKSLKITKERDVYKRQFFPFTRVPPIKNMINIHFF